MFRIWEPSLTLRNLEKLVFFFNHGFNMFQHYQTTSRTIKISKRKPAQTSETMILATEHERNIKTWRRKKIQYMNAIRKGNKSKMKKWAKGTESKIKKWMQHEEKMKGNESKMKKWAKGTESQIKKWMQHEEKMKGNERKWKQNEKWAKGTESKIKKWMQHEEKMKGNERKWTQNEKMSERNWK